MESLVCIDQLSMLIDFLKEWTGIQCGCNVEETEMLAREVLLGQYHNNSRLGLAVFLEAISKLNTVATVY